MGKKVIEGSRFGRYELICRFASGGMADLYLARLRGEEMFERLLAVKVIHEHLSRHTEFVRMFIDEARLASRISHPNVALTLELGRVGATHFIAMEYIEGESLSALLRRCRPPISCAARIVSDAAAGLHAAHELRDHDDTPLGVVHRDVSPQNILISYSGAVKVVDFGVARARGSLHTTSSSFKGKFGYVAPEQVESPRSVDRRTDVFALGIVLFEASMRQRLFKGETEAQTLDRMLRGSIPLPSELDPDFPPQLESIIMRALQRDPGQRYPTAEQLHQDLERFIAARGEPVHSSTIRDLMAEVFADHIEAKRALLVRAASGNLSGPVPDVDVVSASEAATTSSPTPGVVPARRARWPLLLALALLLAATTATVVFYGLRDRPGPGGALTEAPAPRPAGQPARRADVGVSSAPATPEPRTITLSVSALPAGASLRLDGKLVGNPLRLQRPAAPGEAELVVSAPGYQEQHLRLPLSTGGHWAVQLARARPGPPPRRSSRKSGPPAGKKDNSYLDNPYQE